MRYHPDDFLRIEEGVEEIGGMRATGICKPKRVKLLYTEDDGKKRYKEHTTTGCNNEARFMVPYQKPNSKFSDEDEVNTGLAVVCAVDDDMGRWPKFAHLIEEDSH